MLTEDIMLHHANYWLWLVGQDPLKLSVQCLKDSISSSSSRASVLLIWSQSKDKDQLEYRGRWWHSDSKEIDQVVCLNKGIIGSVPFFQGWPWPFFVCWNLARKHRFGGKVQPANLASTLSGPLRRTLKQHNVNVSSSQLSMCIKY